MVYLVTSSLKTFLLLAQSIREPYREWAEGHIQKIRNILNSSRAEHTQAVKDRIQSVEQMKDVVSITKELFAISKVYFYAPLQNSILFTFNDRKLPNSKTTPSSRNKKSPLPLRSRLFSIAGFVSSSRQRRASKPSWSRPLSITFSRAFATRRLRRISLLVLLPRLSVSRRHTLGCIVQI